MGDTTRAPMLFIPAALSGLYRRCARNLSNEDSGCAPGRGLDEELMNGSCSIFLCISPWSDFESATVVSVGAQPMGCGGVDAYASQFVADWNGNEGRWVMPRRAILLHCRQSGSDLALSRSL